MTTVMAQFQDLGYKDSLTIVGRPMPLSDFEEKFLFFKDPAAGETESEAALHTGIDNSFFVGIEDMNAKAIAGLSDQFCLVACLQTPPAPSAKAALDQNECNEFQRLWDKMHLKSVSTQLDLKVFNLAVNKAYVSDVADFDTYRQFTITETWNPSVSRNRTFYTKDISNTLNTLRKTIN